jgi:hypothetical protein
VGAFNTILVGGTIETTGPDSRGIFFDDATGSVQKVHVTDTGLVTASLFSGSGARIAISAGQQLEVLNEGEISGLIVGAELSDIVKVTASGIVRGAISLGGGDDIIDFAGAWKEALADLGDGNDLVKNAGSSASPFSTQTFTLGAGNDPYDGAGGASATVHAGDDDDVLKAGSNGGLLFGDAGNDLILAGGRVG